MKTLLAILSVLVFSASAMAQTSMPPPSNPVVFCGVQASSLPDSYRLVFDGGASEPITLTPSATAGANTTFCTQNAAGFTHSFQIPANRFTVGTHSVVVVSTNDFGSTTGTVYSVLIGIAPGQFNITGVGQVSGGERRPGRVVPPPSTRKPGGLEK